MKKNMIMRFASLLLVVTLLSTCAISGTFAKYTSSATGSDTATVAKWAFNVGDTDVAKNDTFTFDLFSDANAIIAPGSSGSFAISLNNTSDVKAKYTIALEETNASNIPLQYSVDNRTWEDSIAELTGLADQAIGKSASATQTVYWRWVYEGTTDGAHAGQTDVTDTALGTASSAPTVTIKATITATQAN